MTTPVKGDKERLQLPWKLHAILEDSKYASIIAWTSNGESFRILNKKDFTEIIMPLFFTSTCYKSFQRSMNLWGFRVVTSGHHKGEFAHPCFKRGQPNLCMSMKRIKNQGTRKRKPSTVTATRKDKVSNNNKMIGTTSPETKSSMLGLVQTGVDWPVPFLPNYYASVPASPWQDNSTLRSLLFGSTTTSAAVTAPQRHTSILAPPPTIPIMSPFVLNAIERQLVKQQQQQQQQDRERIFQQAAAFAVAGHVLAQQQQQQQPQHHEYY